MISAAGAHERASIESSGPSDHRILFYFSDRISPSSFAFSFETVYSTHTCLYSPCLSLLARLGCILFAMLEYRIVPSGGVGSVPPP